MFFPFRKKVPEYGFPEDACIFAIGDVHGCLEQLSELEKRIFAVAPLKAGVVFLGDYIDRGPDVAGVLEKLSRRRFAGLPTRFLRGNHEDMLLKCLDEPSLVRYWLAHGGMSTLASYRVGLPNVGNPVERDRLIVEALRTAMPRHHLDFLHDLELSVRFGDYLFVHAGIRPGRTLERQSPEDMLTIREPFLRSRHPLPVRVVHGHSVTFEASVEPCRIGVDTGAYATGRLSCAMINSRCVTIMSVDRPESRPTS